jgi:hypothetical protein
MDERKRKLIMPQFHSHRVSMEQKHEGSRGKAEREARLLSDTPIMPSAFRNQVLQELQYGNRYN